MADTSDPIRLAGVVKAVSDPAPGSAVVSILGEQIAQSRGGYIEILVESRTVRVTLDDVQYSGKTETLDGGFRDLEDKLLAPIDVPHAPYSPTKIARHVPKVGDHVEVYGVAIAAIDGVTRLRASLIALNGSLDAMLPKPPERVVLRDQRPTPKSWLGMIAMFALAAIVFGVWRNRVVTLGFFAIAFVVRPRIVHHFRAGADGVLYTPRGYLYFTLYGYSFPGMVFVMAFRGQAFAHGDVITAWFVAGYLFGGVALALANFGVLEPFRRLVAAKPWQGGDADEVRIEGTIADATPTKDGAAIARVEQWDRGSPGGSDPAMRSADFENVGTYTIMSKTGDVVVKPSETQWASSIVTRADHPKRNDQFIQTEQIPIGANAAAVGSIVDGKLLAKGTAPALVLATSSAASPIALARNTIRHDMTTLAALVAAAGVATMLALQ